jgi:geranylgeranyl reductase
MSNAPSEFDVVVVGGGPSGATAANELALAGVNVLLLERAFRIKPCGGAIPPCLLDQFEIPEHLLVARIKSARMISPSYNTVDMPVEGTFVGMVNRDEFDPWLRNRARDNGADVRIGVFKSLRYLDDGRIELTYDSKGDDATSHTVTTRSVIGADGARSQVARQAIPGAEKLRWVLAYHEIVEAPTNSDADYDADRCDVWYQGDLSPDFYAWVFPHGDHASIGTGSEQKEFSAKQSVQRLRERTGLVDAPTVRREGAPIPMKPLKRWDDGRGVLLSGDAAGVVAPASGEGIYYAMLCGRLAATAVLSFINSGDASYLGQARRQFLRLHGRTFWALGLLQRFWYGSDKRREKFVTMCEDPDVQYLTWQSYTQKKLVRRRKLQHLRVFFKDIAQLMGLARA